MSPPARGVKPRSPAGRSVNYATSPLLASKTPTWRSRFAVALVALAFLALIGRAVYVQIVGTDFYQQQGEKRFVHRFETPAVRGRIVDRNGLVLATSVPAPSLWMIPREFEATVPQKQELARLLRLKPGELDDRLESNPKFAWLRRQVEEPLADAVKALGLKGVYTVREFKRKYPEGESAAHVVGFTGVEQHGQEGMELAFDEALQGRNGARTVVRDRLGRIVEDVGDQIDPVHGRDVQLAIDSKVQFFAYQRVRDAVRQHGAKAGSVVVLDVRSGEVLALANYPSFDPGDRQNLTGEQLRNRALTDIFEPGSTMKPFIAALAMETGRARPDTRIDTTGGRITVTGSTFSDVHPHGVLTLAEVIQKSSNVGSVKLAMQMQPREMWELYSSVGLGQRPQIDFPGAVSGRLRPYKTWRPVEQATMSFGYGLSASLLQIARAYTVFARDGEIVPVTLLRRQEPVAGERVMSEATAREVRRMLQMAAGPGGTGPLAQTIGYSVGGKSGTARKQEGRSYTNRYRAWFVGLAPVERPRIVVAVMVDEPSRGQYYGGLVAAPVFSQVVQQTLRTLGVPPDLDVKPQIVTRPVPVEQESF